MIKTLYKCFQHWSEKGSVYIISDTHFMSEDMNWRWNMIKDYPFVVLDSLADDNEIAQRIAEYLVWKINNTVHKNDTLIVLGDVGNPDYIKNIKAKRKILIMGNHDQSKTKFQNKLVSNFCMHPHCKETNCECCVHSKLVYDGLFDSVYEGPLWISEKILLSHEPIYGLENICLNIHGHVHMDFSSIMTKDCIESCGFDYYSKIKSDYSHINCAAELVGFKPVSLKDIIRSGVLKNIDGLHRVTIDNATKNKNNC